MKKYCAFILLAICFNIAHVFAFDDKTTHPAITEAAVEQSVLKTTDYLKNNLGFEKGRNEEIAPNPENTRRQITIEQVISNGARTEDSGVLPSGPFCERAENHFYNPIDQTGINEYVDLSTTPARYIIKAICGVFPVDLACYEVLASIPVYHAQGSANPSWAIDPDSKSGGCTIPGQILDLKSWMANYNQYNELDSTCNYFAWSWARITFIAALLKKEDADRNRIFARMFRSVGQVAHLLQDMAVPAHVRNDMQGHWEFQKVFYSAFKELHPDWWNLNNYKTYNVINWMGNDFEAYVYDKGSSFIQGGGAIPTIDQNKTVMTLWDSNTYRNGQDIHNIGSGLAEYTTANFLSQNKMLDADKFKHPSTKDGEVSMWPKHILAEDGKYDDRYYFKMQQGSPKVQYLAASSFLNSFSPFYCHRFDYLDDVCHNEYARFLIPKAVDYSTGLINYFFRGTLEISMPDQYAIYSIADGSKLKAIGGINQEYFDYIKARVKNTTTMTLPSETIVAGGKLWAIAKYKKLKNYLPALANEGPSANEKEANFSYSVSSEVSNSTDMAEAEEFLFRFEGDNAIPVGIADLTLQVVYQGTIGNELNTAVAVGMKDLTEPTHFSYFNGTDQVYFWQGESGVSDCGNIFSTAANMECIYNNGEQTLYTTPRWDSEGEELDCVPAIGASNELLFIACDYNGWPCLYPYDAKVKISFYPSGETEPENPQVIYPNLHGGRYGRMILLCDDSKAKLSVKIEREPKDITQSPWHTDYYLSTRPCRYFDWIYHKTSTIEITPSRNQEGKDSTGSVAKFRQVRQHGSDFFSNWEFLYHTSDCVPSALKDKNWPAMENSNPAEINSED
jgi:hypothetical protein